MPQALRCGGKSEVAKIEDGGTTAAVKANANDRFDDEGSGTLAPGEKNLTGAAAVI